MLQQTLVCFGNPSGWGSIPLNFWESSFGQLSMVNLCNFRRWKLTGLVLGGLAVIHPENTWV